VYATCTVHPRENVELVEAFSAERRDCTLNGLWQSWPGDLDGGGDGFFAAVLERLPD
jgi:16S rRNA (cytosine967-C5)-methyltransferase